MGIDIYQWRARIGCFSQPVKKTIHMLTLRIKHVTIAIRILLSLLLVVQGVESNPGPGERGRGGGRGRGRGLDGPGTLDMQNVRVTRRVTRNMGDAARASTSGSGQVSHQQLTTWFTHINNPQEPTQVPNIPSTQSEYQESQDAEQTQTDDYDTDTEIDIDLNETDLDID